MRKTIQLAALFGLLFLISAVPATAAQVVLAGSDYLTTLPGTTFGGAPFIGVPVGPGSTDTIVRRLTDADVTGGSASISTEMLALQLVSTLPVDFGLGLGLYYITLQSVRGGPATNGRMTINLTTPDDQLPNTPEGTFSSFFDVFFDIRLGALNGPIAISDSLTLTNSGALWDADPSAGQLLVPGPIGDLSANLHSGRVHTPNLNQMDFFPVGVIDEVHPNGAVHIVRVSTPEPAPILLVACGLLPLLWPRRRR